jgi:hypothetical protein
MSEMSPQRKKVVVLAASIASMSGMLTLLHGHRWLMGAWIAFMAVALVYTISEFAKLKRSER